MARFRKKPVVVEAEQWFPGKSVPGVSLQEPPVCFGINIDGSPLTEEDPIPFVVTAHGQIARIVPGDWIIAEPDGRGHYPCKPDIFAATYEAVE